MIYDQLENDSAPPGEIVLGTGKLTTIFLAAAVVCGTCFGLGYSLGRHSAAKAAEAAAPSSNWPAATEAADGKPSPEATNPAPITTVDDSAAGPAQPRQPAKTAVSGPPNAAPVNDAAKDAASGDHPYVVQVAAISRPGDAGILVAALQRKGYQVDAVPSPQDHLIHVQVGPFENSNDAHAMQERLSDDGYLAIVK